MQRLLKLATLACLAASTAFAAAPARAALAADPAALHRDSGRSEPQRIEVGPRQQVKTIRDAAKLARDGATVEVAAGNYVGDTAVWTQNDLTIRAVGGRVRLSADGAAAEGKGIWVVRAERMTVEGFDFSGAAVPSRNGAGIRLDRGSLRVRDCSFTGNEMGILTGNDPTTVLEIENSEFAYNRRPDGHNHNLYAGTIARLSVTGSYFHHAYVGHLLKSRAAVNHITYNRLTDEGDGSASYELEFPNGGVAYVIGNIIQQSARTENVHLISFGAEGYRWAANELYLVNNTLIDDLPANGVFLRVVPGADVVNVVNNLLVGMGRWDAGTLADVHDNFTVDRGDLADVTAWDLRLRPSSPAWGEAVAPGTANGVALQPSREYAHPRHSIPLDSPAVQPGAIQAAAPRR
jgi:hypothetical protein